MSARLACWDMESVCRRRGFLPMALVVRGGVMCRLLACECRKIAGTWKAWVAVAALVVANLLLAAGTADARLRESFSSPREYKALYEMISVMPERDALLWLDSELDRHSGDAFWKDGYLYRLVRDELSERQGYGEYLGRIQESAKAIQALAMFSDVSSFSYKNAVKTAGDFRGMEDVRPSPGPSLGVALATEGAYTDVLAILPVLAMSLLLFSYEAESGLARLTKATPKGGAAHGAAKLLAVWVGCAVVVAVLYVPKLLLCGAMLGLGGLSRPLQSVAGYSGGTVMLTVGQFLLGYWGLKAAALMALAALFSAFSSALRKPLRVFVFSVASLAAMYALGMIPNWHPLSLLAVVQPLAWLDAEALLARYMNYNIFGTPVERFAVCALSLAASLVALSALAVAFYNRFEGVEPFRKRAARCGWRPPLVRKCRLLYGEAWKLLFQNRAAWILPLLFAAVAYVTVFMPVRERFEDFDAMYYKRITVLHAGELSPAKEDAIYLDARQAGAMATAQLELRLRGHIGYLNGKPGSLLLYDEGYKRLTFADAREELLLLLVSAVALIAVLGGVFTVERQTGADTLLKASRWGTRKAYRAKRVVAAAATLVVAAAVYAPFVAGVLDAYGRQSLDAPAYSMEHLAFLPQGVSISAALALCMALRLALLLVVTQVVLFCSARAKTAARSYLLCCGTVAAPIVLLLAVA